MTDPVHGHGDQPRRRAARVVATLARPAPRRARAAAASLALAGVAVLSPVVLGGCGNGDGSRAAVTTAVLASGADTTAVATSALETAASVRTVNPEAFRQILAAEPGRTLLDLRTPEEMAAGRLGGAANLDFYAPRFAADLGTLVRDRPFAIYCHSGNRSGQTAAMMRHLGFVDVVELGGGIAAWEAAGLPIER